MKVLIAYGSKHGSTGEIAEAIGRRLSERGLEVRVAEAAAAMLADGDQAMIVGSSLYLGRWAPGSVRAVKKAVAAGFAGPVWLFHSGPTGDEAATKREPFPKKITELGSKLDVRDWRTFGGKVDPDDHPIMGRALADEAGDWRDWAEIEGWADGIADALVGAAA